MTGSAQLPLPWPRTVSVEREDFVEGVSNRLALAAVESWPAWPHPVLVLVGPPGSGKSHLAAVFARMSGAVSFRPGDLDPSRPGFAVVFDDIDRADIAEGELFDVLNAARLGNGTVLATSRRRPAEIAVALPDLASRLRAATIAALGEPDDALLEAVLVKLFADRQIEFDARLAPFVVARMERSLDAARRLVEAADRATLATGRRPGRQLLAGLLAAEASDGQALS